MDAVLSIMRMAKEIAGIDFAESKRSMVESRLAKRIRTLGIDVDAYAERCRKDRHEQARMIDLLTTNHTSFLREADHFADLSRRVLPKIAAARSREQQPRLRIWCAAAATGEEPWTIAMTVAQALPDISRWDAGILATDISMRALERARAGEYSLDRVEPLSSAQRQLAIEPVPGAPDRVQVQAGLRRLVQFARLNLMGDWPMRGPFDVIFCRNVMIYFDTPTQERLVNRMARLLAPGGTLYVGHSESLNAIRHPLTPHGAATYVAA